MCVGDHYRGILRFVVSVKKRQRPLIANIGTEYLLLGNVCYMLHK